MNWKKFKRAEREKRRKIKKYLAYLKKRKNKKHIKVRMIYDFKWVSNGTKNPVIKDYTPKSIDSTEPLKHDRKKKIKSIKKKKNKSSINGFEKYVLKKTLCKNFELDLFDFNAYIDTTLNYKENLQELKDNYFSPVWRVAKNSL